MRMEGLESWHSISYESSPSSLSNPACYQTVGAMSRFRFADRRGHCQEDYNNMGCN